MIRDFKIILLYLYRNLKFDLMRKIYSFLLIILITATATPLFAQDEPPVRNANEGNDDPLVVEKGFKKENLFTGGNITLGFSNGYTVLGVSPMIGYKLNNYLDAGAVINYVYTGVRDYQEYDDKLRQHTYGTGVFMRAYPVSFLFAQIQPEYNFITQKYINGDRTYKNTVTTSAPSFLVGGGYAGGRTKGGTNFYYMSILVDVLKNRYSPYVDVDYNGDGSVRRIRMQPIIRAGYNIGLFQKRYNTRY